MTDSQWNELLELIAGKYMENPPVGFIIDSPWLPGWFGCEPIDYYSSDMIFMEANLKAVREFPDAIFFNRILVGIRGDKRALGFWFKTGLGITEPSACRKHYFRKFRGAARDQTQCENGWLASPDEMHALLRVISDYTIDWLRYQKERFPGIGGIMILDDLVGFVGEAECSAFAVPYLKEIFSCFDASVRFFHNDSEGVVIGAHLEEIGVNLFNFSFKHSMQEMRDACGDSVVLMGNIPPRDVLAAGTADDVQREVLKAMHSIIDHRRILWSSGGGVPQGVTSENMNAFINTVKSFYTSHPFQSK